MVEIKSESSIAREFRELMQRRGIAESNAYLDYLIEQKETKRAKSEARMREAELEKEVMEKMKRGEL
ncbi:MAG: hypothetical protein H8D26_04665 [Methanomicrobia archaeon]|nr:hypothetical protein [Methanomicrobia archaeon]